MERPVLPLRSLVPKSARPKKRKEKRKRNEEPPVERKYSGSELTAFLAIEDVLTFVGHVEALVGGEFAQTIGLVGWLDDVRTRLTWVRDAIEAGKLPVGWATPSDNEELDDLEETLNAPWSSTWKKASPLTDLPESAGDLLDQLLSYWADEVRKRAFVVHGLLEGSELAEHVQASFDALARVNYPPEYGYAD